MAQIDDQPSMRITVRPNRIVGWMIAVVAQPHQRLDELIWSAEATYNFAFIKVRGFP